VSSIVEEENIDEETPGTRDMGFLIDYGSQETDLEMVNHIYFYICYN